MKIIAAIILSFVAIASSAYAAEIVAMRASVQKDFHRLTIIFSEDVPVEVSSNGEHLFVKISEFKSKLPADSPVTEYLKVEGLAEKEGHKVLGVLLGSQNRREEAKELLDYSFSIR